MSKKILIMLYQEGASAFESVGRINCNYGLRQMVYDANAAVEAIVDNGGKAYVCDVYGKGRDILQDEISPNAEVVSISALPNVLSEIDGAVLIGTHAKNGAANAFYSYTVNEVAWHEYRLNGTVYGDIGIAAVFLGAFNVPVVAVSGDKAAVEEATALLGDIPSAIVKEATIRNAAKCLPADVARQTIAEAVAAGMQKTAALKPFVVQAPYRVEVLFNRVDFCDDCIMYNFAIAERVAPLIAAKTVEKIGSYGDLKI